MIKVSNNRKAIFVGFLVFSIHAQALNTRSYLDYLGCKDFRGEVFNQAYSVLRDGLTVDKKNALMKSIPIESLHRSSSLSSLSVEEQTQLTNELSKLWKLLLTGADQRAVYDSYEVYKSVAGVEIGDNTTTKQRQFNQAVDKAFQSLEALATKANISCSVPKNLHLKAILSAPDAGEGSKKFFKVFYQDCEALEGEPYGGSHEDLKGVKITGRHPAGGNKREISNLSEVLRTHHHLKRGGEYGSECFDWKTSPPIYDFGGKPYASETHLDFFRNAGSGTSVLGIDCSGVVVSSLAAVGRRLKKDVVLKPDFVHNVSSTMMKEPSSNGLSCLSKAVFTSSDYNMKPGDILAIKGHVTIVAEVGADPWGLNRFSSLSSCKLSNMNVSNFDFKIIQSAPVKGAIGVTRMEAKYYYGDSGSQGQALRSHALNACYAKFGSSSRVTVSTLSIVRHKEEEGCFQEPVPFERQSCVSSCI